MHHWAERCQCGPSEHDSQLQSCRPGDLLNHPPMPPCIGESAYAEVERHAVSGRDVPTFGGRVSTAGRQRSQPKCTPGHRPSPPPALSTQRSGAGAGMRGATQRPSVRRRCTRGGPRWCTNARGWLLACPCNMWTAPGKESGARTCICAAEHPETCTDGCSHLMRMRMHTGGQSGAARQPEGGEVRRTPVAGQQLLGAEAHCQGHEAKCC